MAICCDIWGTHRTMSGHRSQPKLQFRCTRRPGDHTHLDLQLLGSQLPVGLLQLLLEGGNLCLDQQPHICGLRHCNRCLHPRGSPGRVPSQPQLCNCRSLRGSCAAW